jgi:hypothetical protein
MGPFALPLWETDATLRAALQESAQVSVTSLGSGAVLTGGELTFDARTIGTRSYFTLDAHAQYARAFDVTLGAGGGAAPPSDELDADAALGATWTLSPLVTLALTAEGSLATTYGVRADTQLIELDPFSFAQRLEYAVGGDLSLSLGPSRRAGVTVEAGYLQAGALAADSAAAVGVDSHEAHADASYSMDLDARDAVTPEVRYAFVHYDHALLDTELHRGPADIHTVALTAAASRELSRGFVGVATGGVSVGSPMPFLAAGLPVIAPDLGLALRWVGRRARVTARYAYGYASLGPRIGFGQEHSASARLDVRPVDGAGRRDLVVHGTLRFAHGAAPLAADPDVTVIPGMAPLVPTSGKLTTTTLAAGARVDVPISRGFAFTTGTDLVFTHGVVDPAPPGGAGHAAVTALLTVGLAVTVSTDRRRTVTRDPAAVPEDAVRLAPAATIHEEHRRDEAPERPGPAEP